MMFRRLLTACTVTRASFFSKSRKNGTWPFSNSDWKKAEITDHLGIVQPSGNRVLGKQMGVEEKQTWATLGGWLCPGSRRQLLTGLGRPDDESM